MYVPRASFIHPTHPWDNFPHTRYSADITKRLAFSGTLMNLLLLEIQNRETNLCYLVPRHRVFASGVGFDRCMRQFHSFP
jgi:hypothetical protein